VENLDKVVMYIVAEKKYSLNGVRIPVILFSLFYYSPKSRFVAASWIIAPPMHDNMVATVAAPSGCRLRLSLPNKPYQPLKQTR
jgi:hypothetical protein